MTETDTKTRRPRKTAAQRAVEGLAAANARFTRATRNLQAAESAVNGAKAEFDQAKQFLDYAEKHPDLPVSDG